VPVPLQLLHFQCHICHVFVVFNGLVWEVVLFVNIGGIVDHHCLNFFFHNYRHLSDQTWGHKYLGHIKKISYIRSNYWGKKTLAAAPSNQQLYATSNNWLSVSTWGSTLLDLIVTKSDVWNQIIAVCPLSIYGFWLLLCYLQTLLDISMF
jgi:hypothetical protein